MANVSSSTVPANGLPIHRMELPGTRALTALVAFDAGARNEAPEENGMAHFLEHLVFKGGEKFPTYKDVNETAERLGGHGQRVVHDGALPRHADPQDRAAGDARADGARGLRRGCAQRATGGERDGPLPRAPGVQGSGPS